MGKRIDEQSENFNKEMKNIKRTNESYRIKYLKLKKKIEGINIRLGNTEEHRAIWETE